MASGSPKEFLTLPSGPDQNFAIVFADRLADGWRCTGALQKPYGSRVGTTKFSKLRIKFEDSRVEVIRDDHTFSTSTGPNKVDYGHAGDCYSWKQGCAKGTFKVDLTGTELVLAPDVQWVMEERWPESLTINDMSISKDRKIASARCGGWCGHCWPADKKLFLMHPHCKKAASCSEKKSLNPKYGDAEYTLYPFPTNKDVSLRVYCHDMASGNPKEFLTLPSGPDQNYAIVFADRLADGWRCTGALQDPYASRAGTTKFSKLRIKFENSRVEVIRDDYTFAKTTGPNEVDYGHAGDCYSWKQGCAKGTFKVDLTGTELVLAPDVHWVMEERWPESLTIHDMSISKDRKVASARCGGWCGHCWPAGKKMHLMHPQCHKAASCSEVKSLNPEADDGEYTLYPFATDKDVSLRVYCHDMASGSPKEFLTLPSGPDDNYAIVFADRMADGGRCTGALQDPYASRAGTTKFSKLRIKFENCRVEVIRDDYTFAKTTGPNEVDYGHAGDCYSWKQGCAKGTFKVDLTGTELVLAPDVHWVMEERWPESLTINDMFISKDRKVASARCGGWCGHCWPAGKTMHLLHPQCDDKESGSGVVHAEL
ncbi:uncharacterized protein LOC144859951 [Branchiostoma floridae x Branchiostoma japonicum]